MTVVPVVYSRRALGDLEHISDFLHHEKLSARAMAAIIDGIELLSRHPYVGRPTRGGLRELVISLGRTGYVALYRMTSKRVEVLAVRHQHEAGYR